jgi:hypothetical protein
VIELPVENDMAAGPPLAAIRSSARWGIDLGS